MDVGVEEVITRLQNISKSCQFRRVDGHLKDIEDEGILLIL